MRVIFVGGVHGVGKGTVCQELSALFNLPHYSASTLIRNKKKGSTDERKVVVDAADNQDHLLSALGGLDTDASTILLDGHFCLLGPEGIFEVPLSTFKGMGLVGIALIVDEVDEIEKRLESRDGNTLGKETIDSLQQREMLRSSVIAEKVNVPLIKVRADEIDQLITWLEGASIFGDRE